MSTHNICIRREIRKILCAYPLLSVAMLKVYSQDYMASLDDLDLYSRPPSETYKTYNNL